MIVIIINGRGGSGKDQFIEYFTEFAGKNYVLNISTVDRIKEIAKELGWHGLKDDLSRKYLSNLKDIATYWGDIPFKDVSTRARIFNDTLESYGVAKKGFIFIHCREPHEIERLQKDLPFDNLSLLIRRPGDKIYGNHADDEVENYYYDMIIDNSGTLDDLRTAAEDFYKKLAQN